ncbi:hypothetical protein SLS58_009632 [Diplodia intermedia]|uniref:DUF4470 domain-containing protein n=1 Tax=Diplodia intermedia TaxID=856260 RepID=A0ABR3TAY7_9PEZI
MFYPAYVDLAAAFFYPLGNTPAACLTQHLPPALPARVLALGCGDARNVLFTAYCEAARADARPIDVTSCDLQRAVIARNILLFSLILDDRDGRNQHAIWSIYYHQFLDAASFELLRRHAKTLTETSPSLDEWHRGPHGRCLRVCDAATLAAVHEVWLSYVNADARPSRAEFERAKQAQEATGGAGNVITAARSAAPSAVDAVLDAPRLFKQYWRSGTTDGPGATARTDVPNPMFSGQMDNLTLHYGTDPLLGFHLATAYLPLTHASPLNPNQVQHGLGLDPLVKTARLQFEAWCDAFRRRSRQFTLRFFVGEALTFCHVLRQKLTAADDAAQWYRGPYMPDPLILDADDYRSGQAPTVFNVIDTSNLIDHFGSLNLLVATAPLLDGSQAAALVTESLVRRHEADQPPMDALLCGNASALSTLLGLFPVQYWTNTSLVSSTHESLLQSFQDGNATQLHSRLTWKNRIPAGSAQPSCLHYDETDLAQLLYQTYLAMFEGEDPSVLMAKRSARHVASLSTPYYTRASFAAFLRFVKGKVEADWSKAATLLLDLIDKDNKLMLGQDYLQELRVQMHLFDVCSGLIPEFPLEQMARSCREASQLAWSSLPNIVNVTLKVPRSKLRMFHEVEKRQLGTPPLICHTYTATERSSFAAIHLAFGTEQCTGERNTQDFALKIQQDGRGWHGESPLWVSFLVPTVILLSNARTLSIKLALQPTPHAIGYFASKLDDTLGVFDVALDNTEHVFITRCRPNISVAPHVLPPVKKQDNDGLTTQTNVRTQITANFVTGTARISNLTGRVTLISHDLKTKLSHGAAVDTVQVSPCVIAVKIGTQSSHPQLHFPVPVLKVQSKVRIARKSSYIEVIVPIASPSMKHYFPNFIHPIFPERSGPITWNAPYLPISNLPIIDTTASHKTPWLNIHLSSAWSHRERRIRDASLDSASPTGDHFETRIAFKDSLLTILSHFGDRDASTTKTPFFTLSNPSAGGVHVLILASAFRLDLASQSVVLDAACIPLTLDIIRDIAPALQELHKHPLCQVKVDGAELSAWKAALPAMAERARTWAHGTGGKCAYNRGAKSIPLSFADGESVLCACGTGVFPDGYGDGR